MSQGSRTSLMTCMSLSLWGYEKVNIFYGQVRRAENQTLAFEGDLIRGPDGRVWEFVSRKDDQLQARAITIKPA